MESEDILAAVKSYTLLEETLARLEHKQWCEWARSILETEPISWERAERWKQLLVPYDELTEDQKDKDRLYARQVISAIQDRWKILDR